MGAFQTGFGMGQQAFNQAMYWQDRDLERARQAKLDESNLRSQKLTQDAAELRLNQARDEDELTRGARQAGVDVVTPAPTPAPAPAPTSDPVSGDAGAAEASSQDATSVLAGPPAAPAATAPAQPAAAPAKQPGYFDSISGMPSDPTLLASMYDARAKFYASKGRPDLAAAEAANAAKARTDYQAARGAAIINHIANQPTDEGVYSSTKQAFDNIYRDQGLTLGYTPIPSGGVSFNVFDKDGNPVGKSQEFKNANDMIRYARDLFVPGQRTGKIAAADAVNAEVAKASAMDDVKTRIVTPGAMTEKAGKTGVVNDTGYVPAGLNPDGTTNFVKPNGRGGAAGANGQGDLVNKPPAAISESLKGDPTQIPVAVNNMDALIKNNPSMRPAQAQNIAVRLATTGNAGVRSTFDPKTGLFNQHVDDFDVKDPKGNVTYRGTGDTYLLGTQAYREGGTISPEDGKKAVAQLSSSMPANVYSGYLATQTAAGYKAYMDGLSTKASEIQAGAERAIKAAAGDPAKIESIKQQVFAARDQLEADQRRMELVRRFGVAPKPAPTAAPASAPKPGAAASGSGYAPQTSFGLWR